jgi:hypothetical protein
MLSSHEPKATLATFFCSWASDWQDYTIVEAMRATTAVPTLFKAAGIGSHRMEYLDRKLHCSNPAKYMTGIARKLYRDHPISCLLSLGAGDKHAVSLKYSHSPWWDPIRRSSLLRGLQNIIMSCEQTSQELESEFFRHLSPILYIRLKDFSDGLWPQMQGSGDQSFQCARPLSPY